MFFLLFCFSVQLMLITIHKSTLIIFHFLIPKGFSSSLISSSSLPVVFLYFFWRRLLGSTPNREALHVGNKFAPFLKVIQHLKLYILSQLFLQCSGKCRSNFFLLNRFLNMLFLLTSLYILFLTAYFVCAFVLQILQE